MLQGHHTRERISNTKPYVAQIEGKGVAIRDTEDGGDSQSIINELKPLSSYLETKPGIHRKTTGQSSRLEENNKRKTTHQIYLFPSFTCRLVPPPFMNVSSRLQRPLKRHSSFPFPKQQKVFRSVQIWRKYFLAFFSWCFLFCIVKSHPSKPPFLIPRKLQCQTIIMTCKEKKRNEK